MQSSTTLVDLVTIPMQLAEIEMDAVRGYKCLSKEQFVYGHYNQILWCLRNPRDVINIKKSVWICVFFAGYYNNSFLAGPFRPSFSPLRHNLGSAFDLAVLNGKNIRSAIPILGNGRKFCRFS